MASAFLESCPIRFQIADFQPVERRARNNTSAGAAVVKQTSLSAVPSYQQAARLLRKARAFASRTRPSKATQPQCPLMDPFALLNPIFQHRMTGRVRAVKSANELTTPKDWNTSGGTPQLPPGELGLPLVGETLKFLSAQQTEDPDSFFTERLAKYGNPFRTNLLGKDQIVITGPEAAELVFSDEKLFKTDWPESTRLLLGEKSISIAEGSRHKFTRGLISGPLSLDYLKRYTPMVEQLIVTQLQSWENEPTVRAYDALRKLTFYVMGELIFGTKPGPQAERLAKYFNIWTAGLFSLFLIQLPFTTFGKSMEARENILKEEAAILKERRAALASGADVPNDPLTRMMTEKDEQGAQLTDEALQDILLNLLFAGHDTSASSLAVIIRCLTENPAVVDKLREEYASVRRNKRADEPLLWEDVRHMTYTEKVIAEGLRVTPIVANNFKIATRDVTFNGYLIPKGHSVLLNYRATMCSDAFFPDARAFRPERFDEKPAPYTYLPFGGGERQCPGSALARMEMSVFLFHFVSNYDWTLVNPSETTSYFPLPQPKEGLPIKIQKRRVEST